MVNSPTWKTWLKALALVAIGLFVYWPCLSGGWLWDDYLLIVENLELRNANGLYTIWVTTPSLDYWPLTWTLFRELWQIFGNQPLAFHIVSLALHLCSALLVWRLLGRLGLRWGWLGALLFTVHPLAVESVSWISEIKNTLSLPLFLLSLEAYIDADERGSNRRWFHSFFLYLAAMLAKTSVIMLPMVLLLYTWWKHGRITAVDLRKIAPFLIVSFVLGFMTLYFQTVVSYEDAVVNSRSPLTRVIGAGVAISFYLGKFLLPVGLLPVYPRWPVDHPSLAAILSGPLLAMLLYGCWLRREGWGRHALFGLGFFLVNLLPVVGLVKMSYLSISWVADHFVYLPMLGLIGLVVAGVEQIHRWLSPNFRPVVLILVAGLLALLTAQSRGYASIFGNEEVFWNYTIQGNPQSWLAHNNLGLYLMRVGRIEEAKEQFTEILQGSAASKPMMGHTPPVDPQSWPARNNLGLCLLRLGLISEAKEQVAVVLQGDPDNEDAHNNLGNALRREGNLPGAIKEFEEAIRLKPHDPKPYNNLAGVLMASHRYPEAIQRDREALQLDPDFAEAHNNLALAMTVTGNMPEAIHHYNLALRSDPDYVEALNGLGNALMVTGHLDEAQESCEKAIRLKPNYPAAHATLGLILGQQGQIPEGIQELQIALKLDPKNVKIQQGLAWLQSQQNGAAAPH